MSSEKLVAIDRAELEDVIIDALDCYRIRHADDLRPRHTPIDAVAVLLVIALACVIVLMLIFIVQALTLPAAMRA